MDLNITGAFKINNYDKSIIRHLSLVESPISMQDLSGLDSLTSLTMSSCIGVISIKELSAIPLKSLVIKAISHQSSIDFADLRYLRLNEFTYTLQNRYIVYNGTAFPPLDLNLTRLYLENAYVSDILTNLKSPLISLILINCGIRSSKGISNFPGLIELNLSYNHTIELDSEINKLTELLIFDISNTSYFTNALYSLDINILHAIRPKIRADMLEEIMKPRLGRIKRAL